VRNAPEKRCIELANGKAKAGLKIEAADPFGDYRLKVTITDKSKDVSVEPEPPKPSPTPIPPTRMPSFFDNRD